MTVLRSAVLILALALPAAPAAARIDDLPAGFVSSSPEQAAVRSALAEATDSNDPIEAIVLDGIRRFYEARDLKLLWLADRKPLQQMTALRQLMDQASGYGLDPASYPTPNFTPSYSDGAARLARADVEFSLAVGRFVTHIASGRIQPTVISKLITLEPERPAIGEALRRLSRSTAIAVDLRSYEPSHRDYRALKSELARLRALPGEAERVVVPEGDLLKPGKSDDRVPLLRSRLGLALAADAEPNVYDDALVEAVKVAQAEAGLNADGVVGPQTLGVLNGRSREEEIASVIANLERWRWMPRDLGAFHIMVNVPEFMVRVRENGLLVHSTRVIVGKPNNPTPTFSHVMSHLIVNPYWNIPTSIVSKEMLPEIQADPYGYFARQGYQVFARVGGKMRQIDPAWVDWYSVNPRSVQIRQVPGDFNALGRIKFMFPNQHSVYLHDTPSKRLFQRDRRALSHGCVRVENPLDFADALLKRAAPDWNSKRLQKLYGGPEQRVDLDTPIPVHLAYFTASVGADGTLRHFEDIYGYDATMTAFLGS